MNKVVYGPNSLNQNLNGKTVEEVTELLEDLFGLSGDETVKVNGVEVDDDYVIEDGDTIEYVKSAGSKGSGTVKVIYGVNNCNITPSCDETVASLTEKVKDLFGLLGYEIVKLNGVEAYSASMVKAGDVVEYVKTAGSKGSGTVKVVYGVNSCNITPGYDETVSSLTERVKDLFGLSGDETVKINGIEVNSSASVEAGDIVEYTKAAGSKG